MLIIPVQEFILLSFTGKKVKFFIKKEPNKYYIRAYRDKPTSALSMLLVKLEDIYVNYFIISVYN